MRPGVLVRTASVVVALISSLALVTACRPGISIGPAATTTATMTVATQAAELTTETAEAETPTLAPEPPTAEPTAPPVGATIQCKITALRGLNLRSGPGTDYPAQTVLPHSEVLTATGRSTEGDWVAVHSSGGDGWVASNFVDCGGGVPTLPEATPNAAPPVPTPKS